MQVLDSIDAVSYTHLDVYKRQVPERMEIISGECRVKIADSEESELFRAGQSFYVPGNSRFKIETDDVLDYVCHLEG